MVINKKEIMETYARHEGDTGSPEAVSYTHLTLPTILLV